MPVTIYLLLPVLIIASWMDLRYRRIPNSLLIPSFFVALVLNFILLGPSGLLHALAGTLAGFLLLIIPYLTGGIGAGDVKLLMIIGSFGGIYFVLYSFLAGALIGGVIAFSYLILSKRTMKRIPSFPYAFPLSVGVFAYMILKTLGVLG